jgi:hypothetical protein
MRQAELGWGAKAIERPSHRFRTAFPDMKGFSARNLMYMRAFAEQLPAPGSGCQAKTADDNPTIGLLLGRSRNRVVAEYALRED